jgi:hypothetical protein
MSIGDTVINGMRMALKERQSLFSHALLTVRELEMRLAKRGCTTGKKKWELKLLKSAYDALSTPPQDRKFGL